MPTNAGYNLFIEKIEMSRIFYPFVHIIFKELWIKRKYCCVEREDGNDVTEIGQRRKV